MPTKPLKTKPDSRGYIPALSLIHTRWRHYKGGTYIISDFLWQAEDDVWEIAYHAPHSTQVFTRTPANFFMKVEVHPDPVSPITWVDRFTPLPANPVKRNK